MPMPKINFERLDPDSEASDFAGEIVNRSTGRVRATKPPIRFIHKTFKSGRTVADPHAVDGQIAYVWRMVVFAVSPKSQHQCMPMTAEFGLQGDYQQRRETAARLDKIVDEILEAIPKSQWHGIIRWGFALGKVRP